MKSYLELFRQIFGVLRWRSLALLALMILVGLTEGLAITLLLPLLSYIGISYSAGQGATSALLNRGLAALGGAVGPLGLLAIVVAVAAVQTLLTVALQLWTAKLSRTYQRRRQLRLFAALMRAQWEFVIGRKAGEFVNALVSEGERLAQAFYIGLYLISTFVATCIYLTLALLVAWQITLVLLACAALMSISVLRLYRLSFAVGKAISPLNAELQSVLTERIAGIKIVKAATGEDLAVAQVDGIVNRLERANKLATFLPGLVRGLFEFFAFIVLAAIFVLGERGFGIAPGNVIVVFALFVRLFPRITTLQGYLHMLNSYLQALHTVDDLQAEADARAERLNESARPFTASLPTRLVFDKVDVCLSGHEILHKVEWTVPVPGMAGIVGSSGAGKSTLVHALLGLVTPAAGTIRLGGSDLASAPLRAWRRNIGYVPQETTLFHASIRDNLALTKRNASSAEIERAAKLAHAHEFIRALPHGYDTVIGDQGVKLSGGQRQRLAIARALLADPILLLLDEALNALDTESEAELLETLEELRQHVGVLVVAHRLAAVRTADTICVMEAGRVVETGSWHELMARRSRLYALVEAQAGVLEPVLERVDQP